MNFEEMNGMLLTRGFMLLSKSEKPMRGVDYIAVYSIPGDRGRILFVTPQGWGRLSSEAYEDAIRRVKKHLKAFEVPPREFLGDLAFQLRSVNAFIEHDLEEEPVDLEELEAEEVA